MSELGGDDPPVVRLVVADDHALLRSSLCDILRREPSLEVVAEAGSGDEAIALAHALRPDVLLLDVEMPGQRVDVTVRQLRADLPETKVLVLSMYDDEALVRELMVLGVSAYVHKSATRETLVSALRLLATSDQQIVISVPRQPWTGAARTGTTCPAPSSPLSAPPAGQRPAPWPTPPLSAVRPTALPATLPETPPGAPLSARELEVLAHVATALSNRQIAARLGITESTVKRHLRNIFGKLDAVSRIDAVNKAKAAGLSATPPQPSATPGRAIAAPTSWPNPSGASGPARGAV